MNKSFSLVTELERLAGALGPESGTGESSKISLQSVAERIAKSLGVKADEVAILGVSTRWKHLHFLAPEALSHVGYIPLSSNSALAARTARESRPEIINNFSAVRHASVFEGVKVGAAPSEAIQKIISAPILADGKVVGIIQISRKGLNAATVGPDFTASDLGQVLALCKPLGKLLRHVVGTKA
jgi:GAF domain-containing protein